MTVDLSGDEIGLIQECLYVRIANLKHFERDYENQQKIQGCEKLLDKICKWQEVLEQNKE